LQGSRFGGLESVATGMITTIMNHRRFIETASHRTNHVVFGYLLLAYFALYAISPLSSTFTVIKPVDKINATNGMSQSETEISIFLLEVICAKIDAKKDFDSGNSRVRILIRKVRAILPESAGSDLIPFGILTSLAYLISIPDNFASKLSYRLTTRDIGCAFNLLHSGPAPPSLFV
jgi:hypothetical protein